MSPPMSTSGSSETSSSTGVSGESLLGASTFNTFFSSSEITSSFSKTNPNPAPPAIALPSDSNILVFFLIP